MVALLTRRVLTPLLLCVAVVACGGQQKFEKKFDVKSGGMLKINTDVGEVKVAGGSSGAVTVLAEIEGRDADEFEVNAVQTGNDVEITGKAKREGFWNSFRAEVKFTVTVPSEYNIAVHTSGGGIEVKAVKGQVRLETSGGGIAVLDVAGNVDGETSGGSIKAENVSGTVKLETSGGSIRGQGLDGDVNVETSGGSIKLGDVKGKVHAETSGGGIAVAVTGPNKGISVETSGGGIDLSIGKSVGAEIDAATSGGDVDCELPITVKGKISGSKIKGTVNGGGPLIYARTSGGGIRIRAKE
jgi:hypothetical protein